MCRPTLNHKLLQFYFHAVWVGFFSLQVCEHEVYRQADLLGEWTGGHSDPHVKTC